jgi:AhpD family alkylhydroperoxidase
MNREQVYRDIEETLGLVPSFFKTVPDSTLDADWKAFKAIQLDEGAIPGKYRELIGVGISAVTKCRYCVLYHTEAAKMMGATDEEIHEALRYAGNSALWSTWLNGEQVDFDQFRDELMRIRDYLIKKEEQRVGASV